MTDSAAAGEDVVIIGAGPTGLAVARQLGQHGIDALILDRADAPASAWRTRYDGFRLNTCGFWSHLPGQPIPVRHGRWPGRDEMIAYFDDYVRRQRLRLRLGVNVTRLERDGARWRLETDAETCYASAVLVATGNYHTPWVPPWDGSDGFTGDLLHSAEYRNAEAFTGCDVLVVGSGNSATEIALQLSDGVARRVAMSVRTPPHLVPRSAAGLPVDALSPVFRRLPVPVLDRAADLMQRLWFGDLSGYGLPRPGRGLYSALLREHRIPTIGDRLVPRVKTGRVEIVAAVTGFDGPRVLLADGSEVRPDVVIAATGYQRGLEPVVGHLGVLTGHGLPVSNGTRSAAAGLWFLGYAEPLIGPLRALRHQAGPVAREMAAYLTSITAPAPEPRTQATPRRRRRGTPDRRATAPTRR
ncbi:flavin-containing monooxygenase [Mycobacterium sp. SMC-4]|uniref:flavin-containing monooxygenase n=1 Tax=Mycobacterium sp. SMC-4 TaxID=2857059 RepID=UPI003CFDCC3D